MFARQMGQSVNSLPQGKHVTKCPHGTNTASLAAVRQTTHNLSSFSPVSVDVDTPFTIFGEVAGREDWLEEDEEERGCGSGLLFLTAGPVD
jgi:hypothetical protein